MAPRGYHSARSVARAKRRGGVARRERGPRHTLPGRKGNPLKNAPAPAALGRARQTNILSAGSG